MKKFLKVFFLVFLGFGLLLSVVSTSFLYLSPQFGQDPTQEQIKKYKKTGHYRVDHFININGVKMRDFSLSQIWDMSINFFSEQPRTIPKSIIPVQKIDSINVVEFKTKKPRVIWFGHSAILLQIQGKNILLDPMFGDVPAPHPLLGSPRFNKELPLEVEKLPQIDAVIFSHDHYDHLDYESVMKLKDKVGHFYTPLGVGNHIASWGVSPDHVTQLDWWQEVDFDGLKIVCTPAQHFSGRALSDRGATLWSSWVIKSDDYNVFFSGDSGYGPHFKQIGEKYGPFDFALMECGQYNELWEEIHMLPHQTIDASLDLGAKVMMPIHWASFKLALHEWDDPVLQATKLAEEKNVNITTPKIGEPIILDKVYPAETWWVGLK